LIISKEKLRSGREGPGTSQKQRETTMQHPKYKFSALSTPHCLLIIRKSQLGGSIIADDTVFAPQSYHLTTPDMVLNML
jgi:hypothetical protein